MVTFLKNIFTYSKNTDKMPSRPLMTSIGKLKNLNATSLKNSKKIKETLLI